MTSTSSTTTRETDMRMKNPPHPGRIVRQECIEALGLSITEAAKALGVARQTLNNLVNEKSHLSLDMAIRLSKAFGGTPEGWMKLQLQYDVAQVEKRARKINVKPVTAQVVLGGCPRLD